MNADVSARFADALDEVVSPMGSPRHVVPTASAQVRSARETPGSPRWGCCGQTARSGTSVPTVLARTGQLARVFTRSFDRWVGGAPALYTGSPEGEGVLVTHRGSDPFDVTTVLRTQWR